MARALSPKKTIDFLREEVWFTEASLAANADGEPYVALTASWEPLVDGLDAEFRAVAKAEVQADALFMGANTELDEAVIAFFDSLHIAVRKDHADPRWTRYATEAPSVFIKQPLADEIAAVRSWLAAPEPDPVLETHRTALEATTSKAERAIAALNAVGQRRAVYHQHKTEGTAKLTAERDALERTLGEVAAQKGLGRKWPQRFFRQG